MTCVASFPLVLFSLGPAPAPELCGFSSRGRGNIPCIYKTHLPWRVDGFIPKPFSSRDPRRLELCAYPPYPPFSTLFLKALKIVLVSFAAWTSNCMKCNKSHFTLKRVNVEDNVQDDRIWKHSIFRKCPLISNYLTFFTVTAEN